MKEMVGVSPSRIRHSFILFVRTRLTHTPPSMATLSALWGTKRPSKPATPAGAAGPAAGPAAAGLGAPAAGAVAAPASIVKAPALALAGEGDAGDAPPADEVRDVCGYVRVDRGPGGGALQVGVRATAEQRRQSSRRIAFERVGFLCRGLPQPFRDVGEASTQRRE